jgi:hypothetical protein
LRSPNRSAAATSIDEGNLSYFCSSLLDSPPIVGWRLLKIVGLFGVTSAIVAGLLSIPTKARLVFLSGLFLGFLFGLFFYLVCFFVVWPVSLAFPRQPYLLVTLGVPLLLLAVVLTGYAEMALLGRLFDEYEREWRSRLGACLPLIHSPSGTPATTESPSGSRSTLKGRMQFRVKTCRGELAGSLAGRWPEVMPTVP